MKKIETNIALLLHDMLIRETGGRKGVRDLGLLDSALNSPFQTFGGIELYLTIEEKAAKLCHGLICNHSFIDGNKRIGILCFLTFLEINGINLNYTDKDLYNLGMGIASNNISYEKIVSWVEEHKSLELNN